MEDTTYWIDACQNDGNLLATCGYDCNVKIFDKRVSKIINTFDDIHCCKFLEFVKWIRIYSYLLDAVFCVRWSQSGGMLATASNDDSVIILDFKTGKVLYTGYTDRRIF